MSKLSLAANIMTQKMFNRSALVLEDEARLCGSPSHWVAGPPPTIGVRCGRQGNPTKCNVLALGTLPVAPRWVVLSEPFRWFPSTHLSLAWFFVQQFNSYTYAATYVGGVGWSTANSRCSEVKRSSMQKNAFADPSPTYALQRSTILASYDQGGNERSRLEVAGRKSFQLQATAKKTTRARKKTAKSFSGA